ncbi:MAG TPA: RNA polymerase sigma factor [Bryobacteraceae bacterium]|nr:RNA polymerase sigma factor [Bryobacteraceae bacterium]
MRSFTGTDTARFDVGSSTILDRAARDEKFDRMLAAHGPALSRLAASYTNTAHDRDDLLQEIAIAIWQALPRFRGECSERTFLYRIAHNRGIAYLSRWRSQRAGSSDEIEAPDPGPDPESGLAREQQAERLRAAIHHLPIVYRQVIMLTLEGLGYGEIADVLGISESNVGARLTRARQMLRESLEKRK